MFQSKYQLKISGRDTKYFIKQLLKRDIYFEKIYLSQNEALIIVDKQNHEKIKNIKTIYEVTLIRSFGIAHTYYLIKKYALLLISSIIGFCILFLVSNIIFEIEIVHNNQYIRKVITNELKYYQIEPFKFFKTFAKQEEIVKNILQDNRELLEWIELERVGVKYIVRVEERIINKEPEKNQKQDIVAKKEGIILSISAESGEIIKKVNDYVKKGDIIISGSIMKNDKIVKQIKASGTVYAETWYQVKVSLPIHYYEEYKTGKKQKALQIKFLNHSFSLFDFQKYKDKEEKYIFDITDFLHIFHISIIEEEEVKKIEEVYDITSADAVIDELARNKLKMFLSEDATILSQKKLKIEEKNSTIISTVFFKVRENITEAKAIVKAGEEK